MIFEARTKTGRDVYVIDAETGLRIETAFYVNTDEGYVEKYVLGDDGKILVDPQNDALVTRRIYIDFDVVNKRTGELVAQARRSLRA